jgi:hypothetical protein
MNYLIPMPFLEMMIVVDCDQQPEMTRSMKLKGWVR